MSGELQFIRERGLKMKALEKYLGVPAVSIPWAMLDILTIICDRLAVLEQKEQTPDPNHGPEA